MRRSVIFLGLVFMMVLGVSKSVMAFSLEENKWSKEEYKLREAECIEKIRMVLLEKGCKNSGITLTYVSDQDENRVYTVTVHHRKLKQMTKEEWSLVEARIKNCGKESLDTKISNVKILSDR